jgi:hypothetical protein
LFDSMNNCIKYQMDGQSFTMSFIVIEREQPDR